MYDVKRIVRNYFLRVPYQLSWQMHVDIQRTTYRYIMPKILLTEPTIFQ